MISKILVVFFPFHYYCQYYGVAQCESLHQDMSFARVKINAIASVVRKIPRYLPWRSKCLDQAMAAQRMLKRRHLQTTLYFGLARDLDAGGMKAHAWLRCGDRWVVGYQPNIEYTIVGVYAAIPVKKP